MKILLYIIFSVVKTSIIQFTIFTIFLTLTQVYVHWFFYRERKGETERERNIDVREKHQLVASRTCTNQGLNLQPKYVPWLGTEPQPFGVWGNTPTSWATG